MSVLIKGTYDPIKAQAEAQALYDLYNCFGRFKVTEGQFVEIYLKGKLPEFIKRQMEEKDERAD